MGTFQGSSPASPASGGDRVGIPPWLPTRRRGRGLCGPPASHSPAPPSFRSPQTRAPPAPPPPPTPAPPSLRSLQTGASRSPRPIVSLTYPASTLASPIGRVVGEAWFS